MPNCARSGFHHTCQLDLTRRARPRPLDRIECQVMYVRKGFQKICQQQLRFILALPHRSFKYLAPALPFYKESLVGAYSHPVSGEVILDFPDILDESACCSLLDQGEVHWQRYNAAGSFVIANVQCLYRFEVDHVGWEDVKRNEVRWSLTSRYPKRVWTAQLWFLRLVNYHDMDEVLKSGSMDHTRLFYHAIAAEQ